MWFGYIGSVSFITHQIRNNHSNNPALKKTINALTMEIVKQAT